MRGWGRRRRLVDLSSGGCVIASPFTPNAAIQIEIPNTHIDYFGTVKKVGDQYQIFDSTNSLKGNFSTLSKTLAIQLPIKLKTDFFDGTCKNSD